MLQLKKFDVLLRESNKEYPLDLPPNLEEIGNLCPDDDINMTLKEAEEDFNIMMNIMMKMMMRIIMKIWMKIWMKISW